MSGRLSAATGLGPGAGLRLHRAERAVFDAVPDRPLDPRLPEFVADLVRPHRLPVRTDLLDAGVGQSYAAMAEALVVATVPPAEPVDLLVLAYGVHDTQPARPTGLYLSHVCPGNPMAFAVCDQGTAAAFTALRLIDVHRQAGDCRRALLIVAEQPTLHYEPAGPAPLPAAPAAVSLLFDPTGQAELSTVRQWPGVSAERAGQILTAELPGMLTGRAGGTLLAGPGVSAQCDIPPNLAAAPSGDTPAPPGRIAPIPTSTDQPYTGLWWELAGRAAQWADAGQLVLLADHDQATGVLSLCAVDFGHPAAPRSALVAAAGGS